MWQFLLFANGFDRLRALTEPNSNAEDQQSIAQPPEVTPYDVFLIGDDGNDIIRGGPGDDGLNGGPGNDTLNGDGDSDLLIGDEGDDTMDGGLGFDFFTFASGSGVDTILNFSLVEDIVVISTGLNGSEIATEQDILDILQDTPSGVFIDLGLGNAIVLNGTVVADLTVDNFIVRPDPAP